MEIVMRSIIFFIVLEVFSKMLSPVKARFSMFARRPLS